MDVIILAFFKINMINFIYTLKPMISFNKKKIINCVRNILKKNN